MNIQREIIFVWSVFAESVTNLAKNVADFPPSCQCTEVSDHFMNRTTLIMFESNLVGLQLKCLWALRSYKFKALVVAFTGKHFYYSDPSTCYVI